jgi:enoyl-[acyl-carrier-protein] reductase (NADH)
MNISAFSFVDVAKRASKLMPNGGSLITLTYLGSERVIPNYNTMGVAKAALEAATRYIARDLGPKNIRVNAISAGAMRTLSLAGISGGRGLHSKSAQFSADQGRDLDGRRCGRGPVAVLGPGPLDHGRGRPRRCRLPRRGPAGRHRRLIGEG